LYRIIVTYETKTVKKSL